MLLSAYGSCRVHSSHRMTPKEYESSFSSRWSATIAQLDSVSGAAHTGEPTGDVSSLSASL
jgi:hypothetical protein